MIRGTLVFLLALALGALTVSGQQGEAEADLRRRIRELTNELKRRTDGRAAGNAGQVRAVVRIREIGDLLLGLPDERGAPIDLLPSGFRAPRVEPTEPVRLAEVDTLIELIHQCVEPESWETVENADIKVVRDALAVTTLPHVQRKVAAFLGLIRRNADRRMRVRFVAVPVTERDLVLLGTRPRELSAAEAASLLARKPLGVVATVCRSGQQLTRRSGRRVSYLQDYDVEIAQEATIGRPRRWEAFSGMALELAAFLDDVGQGARLDFEVTRTKLTEPIRRVDTKYGALELPELAMTRLRTSTWVPLGKTCIVGGSTSGRAPCLFVVTVDRLAGP